MKKLYDFGWPVTEEIREEDLKPFKVRLLTMLEEVDEILGSPKPKADPSYVQNSTFPCGGPQPRRDVPNDRAVTPRSDWT